MTGSKRAVDPIHPGEILQTDFLGPHGISRARLAHATGLSYGRLTRLARDRGRLSGEAALLLARVFRATPEFWLNLQAHHDLARARAQLAPAQVARAKAFGVQLRRARGAEHHAAPEQAPAAAGINRPLEDPSSWRTGWRRPGHRRSSHPASHQPKPAPPAPPR